MRGHSRIHPRQTGQSGGIGTEPDFRVTYSRNKGWEIEVISPQAHAWLDSADQALLARERGCLSIDLAGVNRHVHIARSAGLRTEYIGLQRLLIT